MDNNTGLSLQSTTNSIQPHKFFERHLNNDLNDLAQFLLLQKERFDNNQMVVGNKIYDGIPWEESGSTTTSNWYRYNVFQMYHPSIYNLVRAVKSMTEEACEYYGIDYDSQDFWTQSWFNVNYTKKGRLDWHEHGGNGAPSFHGYYCVKAEPSITHYVTQNGSVDNINKDNRAILSETGHPHAMADWDWEGPRITIAYDVTPGRLITKEWEQHWIPLTL